VNTTRALAPGGEPIPLPIDVVSIMSQVVYGRVGNNVTVPTLGRHGLTVAAVPTVVFSNTPHYPSVHGGVVPLDWFGGYLDDLLAREALHQLKAVILGFLGSPGQVDVLVPWLEMVRRARPGLTIVIDPVIGDHDHGVYVDPALADAYRDQLIHSATGLTPNGFELGRLTGMPTDGIEDVIEAARTLLVGVTQWVVVTSAAPATWTSDEMRVIVVTPSDARVLAHPRLPVTPKGTGDLFAASLTARVIAGVAIVEAATQAYLDVLAALRATHAAHCAELLLPERRQCR